MRASPNEAWRKLTRRCESPRRLAAKVVEEEPAAKAFLCCPRKLRESDHCKTHAGESETCGRESIAKACRESGLLVEGFL